MSASSRRAARRELEAARLLGTGRVHRRRGERAPDLPRVELPSGEALIVEVKTRAKLPALAAAALEQARGYDVTATPVAVVSQLGGRALAWLELRDLARLLGFEVAAVPSPRPRPRKKRDARQLVLGGCA